jgi:hypothetical protein
MNKATIDMLTFTYGYKMKIEQDGTTPFFVSISPKLAKEEIESYLRLYRIDDLTIQHHKMMKDLVINYSNIQIHLD